MTMLDTNRRRLRTALARTTRTVVTGYLAILPALPGGSISGGVVRHAPDSGADSTHVVLPLDATTGLTLIATRARAVTYHGRKAVELTGDGTATRSGSLEEVALLDQLQLKDGAVEVWVAGTLGPDAAADDRGFIGLVFRSTPNGSHFENIYLRPTNGRAEDQLRRNHSTQYSSLPDYPWSRLRAETPGKYESYVDLVAGEWTHIRIVVSGQRATLYVNDATEPCLVVTDLKMGTTTGRLGLWIGPGTRGYFSQMVVTRAAPT